MLTFKISRTFSNYAGILPAVKNDLRYDILKPEHSEEACHLIGKYFAMGNPLYTFCGLSEQDQEEMRTLTIPRTIELGLSVGVWDTSNDKLVGTVVTEDSSLPPVDGWDKFLEKNSGFLHLQSAITQLKDAFFTARGLKEGELPTPGDYLYQQAVVVNPKYTGNGIAHQIADTAMAVGKVNGYKEQYTLVGHAFLAKMLAKMGATHEKVLNYKELDPKSPLAALEFPFDTLTLVTYNSN